MRDLERNEYLNHELEYFYGFLKTAYGNGKPIFVDEILYKNKNVHYIEGLCDELCQEGKLSKYEINVYYFPVKTMLNYSSLNSREVIFKTFIQKQDNIIGYYTNVSLLKGFHFFDQEPNKVYIITNKASDPIKEIRFANSDLVLIKSKVRFNNSNYNYLILLEMIISINDILGFDEYSKKTIYEYIEDYNVDIQVLKKYASQYLSVCPDIFKLMKKGGISVNESI